MFRTSLRLRCAMFAISATLMTALSNAGFAQKKYDAGATDTEIKIGNIVAYSGPVSSLGVIARIEDAYFKKINDEGGINGRKIKFISYDDAYSPPKSGGAGPQARRKRRSAADLQSDRNSVECRDSEISECEKGCRSSLLAVALRDGMTRRIFPGRWATNQITRTKGGFTRSIC